MCEVGRLKLLDVKSLTDLLWFCRNAQPSFSPSRSPEMVKCPKASKMKEQIRIFAPELLISQKTHALTFSFRETFAFSWPELRHPETQEILFSLVVGVPGEQYN